MIKRISTAFCAITLLLTLSNIHPVQAQVAIPDDRPALPDEETHATTHFLIHYTRRGEDAVEEVDSNNNGVPDFVDAVGTSLEETWDITVNQFGWAAPIEDRGEGGDTRIDVYLENSLDDGYAGYVETGAGYLGDNPNTSERERNAAYGFMVLDNDYLEVLKDGTGETPEQLMRATVAHEFHHLVQATYDDNDPHFWLYEASATWMEDEVYDDVNDGVWYLDAVFKSPDTCLVSEGGTIREADDGRWYADWLLLRLMSERYGHEMVRSVWEYSRRLNGFDSLDNALAPYGSTLIQESRDFGVANLLRAYEEGESYPTVKVEGIASFGSFSPTDGVQSLATDYVGISASETILLTLNPAGGTPLYGQVVGIRGSEADVIPLQNGQVVVDMNNYDEVFLVIHNDDKLTYETDCSFAGYTLNVEGTAGSQSAVTDTWPASFYASPIDFDYSSTAGTTTLAQSDRPFVGGESDNYSQYPTDLPIDFGVLVPLTLPPGYSFDYAYVMTAEEFGESDIYYVPGGGDSANFDYIDAAGNWLSVAESPSPYQALEEWLTDINYDDSPGTIRQIAGVDVLVEDLSEEGNIWYSATLIIDGLFIVVDGDQRESEVVGLVEGIVAASNSPDEQPGVDIAPQIPGQEQPAITEEPPTFLEDPLGLTDEDPLDVLSFGMITLCCGGLCLIVGGAGVVAGMVFRRRRRRVVGNTIDRTPY